MKQLFTGLTVLIMLSACNSSSFIPEPIVDSEVNSFEECLAAGNMVSRSHPRQCTEGDRFFIETPDSTLTDEQIFCTKEYRPVCGEIQVQCIKTPCLPIKTTFENQCEAKKVGAKNVSKGACVDETPNPEGTCLSFDGIWLAKSKECEGMPQKMCQDLGGVFTECATACRNDPAPGSCPPHCVQVCKF